MLPSATISKSDGNTGVVKPATSGVLAIIAGAERGTVNQPASFARLADAVATFGLGPLVEFAAYVMQNAKKPVVLIRANTTTASGYSALDITGMTGTSVPSAHVAAAPKDDYNAEVEFVQGGTIGVAGITYKYTLDGGQNWSPVTALGTANTIALNVPVLGTSAGVEFDLAAGTIIAGDKFSCTTQRAQMTNADLTSALESLRTSRLPWDAVIVDGDASTTMVSTLDSWLAGLESTGKFKAGYINTRRKGVGESEATFAGIMGTLLASVSSTRLDVGCDGGDLPSPVTGLVQARPVSLGTATRAMTYEIGVDPAFVGNGPIPGFQIADSNGNPKYHNEALYPGLDDLRLTTFRSFDTEEGVFLTNANLLSPSGSDYVYDQHVRTMNAACTIAYAMLTRELSRSVRKQAPDRVTGKVYILEQDAAAIETLITNELQKQLTGQVNDVALVLSRTDDLSSNGPGTITGEVQVQSLEYIKDFAITAKFVKSISVTT